MINPILFFLPGLLILGIATTYTDIKEGKIRNKWVLFALTYSLVVHLSFILFKVPISSFYITQTIINLVVVFIVGFLMWDFGLWTAGDGKLFLAFSALVPISTYNRASFIFYFPSATILINTFVPLFVFFFFNILLKTSWKLKKEIFVETLHPKRLLSLISTLFVLGWIMQKASFLIGVSSWVLTIFVMFVFFGLLEKLFSTKRIYLIYTLATFIILFDKQSLSSYFLKGLSLVVLLLLFLRFFILQLGFQTFTKEIKTKDLKPGMVPAEVIEQKKTTKKRAIQYFNIIQYIKDTRNKFFDIKSEGFIKEDIKKIKQLAKKHPDFKTFRVQQTLPFAPFMFLGVLLTVLCYGNVFLFLNYLIRMLISKL